jgi:hypothetical protein
MELVKGVPITTYCDQQQKIEAALAGETAAKGQARGALDALTDDVVETMFARQPELGETEKAFLRKVLISYEGVTRDLGEMSEARLLRAKGFFKVAHLRAMLGEQLLAEAGFRQAVSLLEQLVAEFPDVAEYRQKLATSHHNLAIALAELGNETGRMPTRPWPCSAAPRRPASSRTV